MRAQPWHDRRQASRAPARQGPRDRCDWRRSSHRARPCATCPLPTA